MNDGTWTVIMRKLKKFGTNNENHEKIMAGLFKKQLKERSFEKNLELILERGSRNKS